MAKPSPIAEGFQRSDWNELGKKSLHGIYKINRKKKTMTQKFGDREGGVQKNRSPKKKKRGRSDLK